jgi:CubicO group peptidase (beta-lactamase class C family)
MFIFKKINSQNNFNPSKMKQNFLVFALLLVINFSLIAQKTGNDLAVGSPESVGVSTDLLKRIDSHLKDHLDKKWIPGAVAMVARKGKIIYSTNIGTSGINKQDMKVDDIFRLASMTKPIVTTAIMMLVEEGKCVLEDPISKYIPEFKNPVVLKEVNAKDSTYTSEPSPSEITIRQLLTHTSGIGYGFTNTKVSGVIYSKAKIPDGANIESATIAEKMKILAKQPLLHAPGTKWTYGLGIDVAGYLVEILSGKTLSDFCEERILKPLNMKDTHFYRPESEENRVVSVYTELNGTLMNAMPFPQAKNLYFPTRGAKAYFSGGSGLSGTAADYMKFMQMILNNGTLNGTRILGRKSIESMSNNQIGELSINANGTKFGLGFSVEVPQSSYHKLGSPGRLAWGGLYNTTFWIDPKEQIVAVLMTQIYPSTHQKELYDKFENLVYQAIVD